MEMPSPSRISFNRHSGAVRGFIAGRTRNPFSEHRKSKDGFRVLSPINPATAPE